MKNIPLEWTGKHKVKIEDNLYLIRPLPGFKRKDFKESDYLSIIPECAFRFNKKQAQDQINLLAWDYKIKAKIVK